ncbi:putative DNA-binding transcriptional regulator AlpA [Bradyrhizobium sp. JR7.2]|uniref:helix-turn-helix domain-containing protein n=1 Tax=unclassified Bradyrhizobium TaxID=2631580 RepID=UPI00339A13E8
MQVSTHGNATVRDPFLGTADAANHLNYSESHFRVLVRAGKVPRPTRINGKLLWRQSLLDAHMRQLEIAQGVVSAA